MQHEVRAEIRLFETDGQDYIHVIYEGSKEKDHELMARCMKHINENLYDEEKVIVNFLEYSDFLGCCDWCYKSVEIDQVAKGGMK